MTTRSCWMDGAELPTFPALSRDMKVDAVVVGGGITGITTAFLLRRAGLSVALVERDRCAMADTGHTSAHVTYVTDLRLYELANDFGREHARAVWEAGRAAIRQIEQIVGDEGIDCDWRRVPAYLHAPLEGADGGVGAFEQDAALARELGFDATYVPDIPLFGCPGVRFSDQARFHPLRYVGTLLQRLTAEGGHAFEHTEVTDVKDRPRRVLAGGHVLQCDFVMVATHVPLMGDVNAPSAALFQSKIMPYASYVVGGRIPAGSAPEALFWDTSSPYHFLRIDRHHDHDYVIFGGEDHKTGQASDTEDRFARLEEVLESFLPVTIDHRWSGQVIESYDGLPLIGEIREGQFVSTGCAGNGMTFGTLGAMMACDAALGRANPWRDVFDVRRKTIRGGAWDYLRENLDYPYYMLRDRLTGADGKSLEDLHPGEGKILEIDGQRVAACRDETGNVQCVSSVCTHLGCLVHWNSAERTWDCPCHGSRFMPDGKVLAGPAQTPLAQVEIPSSHRPGPDPSVAI